jgi:preprotein translocase subunit SecY
VTIIVVMVTVLIVQGVRKVPVSVAKKIVQARGAVQSAGVRDYIPLKVNASGVMPIIFAQAVMTVPIMLMNSTADPDGGTSTFLGLGDIFGFGYNAILFVLILVFTYFYTAIMINPKQMAEDMKMQGSFIPGVKPGEDTANYLDDLISRITLPGALFLAVIAILPAFAKLSGVTDGFSMFFGGTSLLIMVAVVLDTLQQIESYLLNRHYDGLMEGTKVRGRRSDTELSGY